MIALERGRVGGVALDEIDEGARRLAGALDAREGERIAILVEPGPQFLEALFGVWYAGACAVILSPLHPKAETDYFLADSGATRVLTRDLPKGPPIAPRPGEAALQLYTSGTTGKPKGAILTHANLEIQAKLLGAAWGWREDDVLLHALPLHHLHGLGIAMLTAIQAGASLAMIPFAAAGVWDDLARATVFMGVPTMYVKLFGAYDAADVATKARWADAAKQLRLATSGSAALPVTLGARWKELTGEIPLERFGMTEIGVGMSNPLAGPRKPGTVGLPLPTVETRIVESELQVRGPSVFAGYWNRPSPFVDGVAPGTPDGWFATGDTVSVDDDGWFKILGRTSVDILKSGGYKISALEIEEVFREHPAVAEVAVVGVPDETWGDRVVACVVLRADAQPDELRGFARERLAPYKVPKEVIPMTELPRNAVGKVIKPALVARLR